MVDILEYECDEQSHNHYVTIDDDTIYLYIPDDARMKVYETCRDGSYLLYEKVGDSHIPYVISGPDHIDIFSYVIKRLYKHTGTIAVLDGHILCYPGIRVNGEMEEEIISTFSAICKEKGIPYNENERLEYVPLSGEVVCYRDGDEIPSSVGIEGNIAISLASGEILVSRRKVKAAQMRKEAIADAILLSTHAKSSEREQAKDLCTMIFIDRSRDMHHYEALGRCLHSIYGGDDEGLDLWVSITIPQRHGLCREYWPDLGTTSTLYTIRFLKYCARMDSPEAYKKWNLTNIRQPMEESVMATGGILDVATVAYRINPSLYISEGPDFTQSTIYKWNGTYYAKCGEYDLRNHLDQNLIPEYMAFIRELTKTIDDTPDNSVREMLQKKMDNAIRIVTKLKDPSYQLNVIKVMCRLYNIPGFTSMKNRNKNITIFEDCIYDCEKKEMRDGIPEDYMTISTQYSFRKEWEEYSWEHPLVCLVMENVRKILFEKETEEYFWYLMSKRLKASNSEKRGLIWYGPTGNAKSHLAAWLASVFGPIYFPDNVPSNLLYSSDAHPGAPSPQWEVLENARLFTQSEITDDHTMNEGMYKRITGSIDTITYRPMFGKVMRSYIPTCVPITVCNTQPKFNGNSAALRARILLMCLRAKFVSIGTPEWEELETISSWEYLCTPTDEELSEISDEEREQYARLKREEMEKIPEDERGAYMEKVRNEYMEKNHWYHANDDFHMIIHKTYKAMMWILIMKSQEFGDKILPIPNSIVMDTVDFFNKSNIYLQFIRQCVSKDKNAPGVSTYALYSVFKKWYCDNVSRFVNIGFAKFLEECSAIRVIPVGDMFRHISIKYK